MVDLSEIDVIAEAAAIMSLLRTTVEHLFLDMVTPILPSFRIRLRSSEFFPALANMKRLKYYASSIWLTPKVYSTSQYLAWPTGSASTLERVALYTSPIRHLPPDLFTMARSVALAFPTSHSSNAPRLHFSGGKEIVWVFAKHHPIPGHTDNPLREIINDALQLVDGELPRMEVTVTDLPQMVDAPRSYMLEEKNWFVQTVADGAIWTMDGMSWERYDKSMRQVST